MHISSKIDQPEIRQILFQPPAISFPSCPQQAEDISFKVDQDVSLTCRFYHSAEDAPTLLYFYASDESIASVEDIAIEYNKTGVNVFVTSIRGYDRSSGSPSFTKMLEDTEKLFPLIADWLNQKGYSGALFVLGRSLGSVCAMVTVLNNSETIKGMVIESGINSTIPFLKAIGINTDDLDISEDDGFDVIAKIKEIKIPTMILHGSKDALVPIDQAENLQAFCGARSKQFFVIPGAERNTLVQSAGNLYYVTMKKFFDTVCGVNTWRRQRKSFKKSYKKD